MLLSQIFENAGDIQIDGLAVNSNECLQNSLFFCIKGIVHDGHRFVGSAIRKGAVAVVHSSELAYYNDNVSYIKVGDTLKALNYVADLFFDSPSKKMNIYAVTGTNGKSSISKMIKDIVSNFDSCGYIGTIGVEYNDTKIEPTLTTPEIISIHSHFNDMLNNGVKNCSMEVSSIGVDQHRIDSIDFDVAIFTNLTHDHLDYHGTIENYLAAKKCLFDMLSKDKVGIYNADDESSSKIVFDCKANCYSYGIINDANYQAKDIKIMPNKTTFTLRVEGTDYFVVTDLLATFNVYNLLASIAAIHKSGYDMNDIINSISCIKQIDGRMEKIEVGQPFNVIVDFAHTPDGFSKIFDFATKITPVKNRIIAVFGSAGKRDSKKRIIFGQLADKYCDMIILTEDDPRNEVVFDIASEIANGIKKTNYIIIESRYDAIRQAVEMANVNDTILLLGKGDENFIYGEFGKEPYMGDDKVAEDVINNYYFYKENENEIK